MRHYQRAGLWLILGFGLIFRQRFMFEPIRGDEVMAFIHFGVNPLAVILTKYTYPNNHLLFSALMHGCILLFGVSPVAMRLPSLVSGVLCIWMTYRLAVALTSDSRVGLLAAYCGASSFYLVYYSVNARGYALQTLWVLLLCDVFFRRNPRLSPSLRRTCVAILGFLLLYTIPSGMIFLGPFFLYLAWLARRRSPYFSWRDLQMTGTLVAVMFGLSILPIVHEFPLLWHTNGEYADTALRMFGEVLTLASDGLWPVPLFVLLFVAAFFLLRRERWWLAFFISVLLIYPAVVIVMERWVPQLKFFPRTYCILFPLIYILISSALVRLFDRPERGSKLLAAGAVVGLLLTSVESFARVAHDPAALYYPNREDNIILERLTFRWARQLGPNDRFLAVKSSYDTTIAYALTASGKIYSIRFLYKTRVRQIDLVGKSNSEINQYYLQTLDERLWTKPLKIDEEPPFQVYRVLRKGLDQPLPRDIHGYAE
jgi:uncharacterized membrane protein